MLRPVDAIGQGGEVPSLERSQYRWGEEMSSVDLFHLAMYALEEAADFESGMGSERFTTTVAEIKMLLSAGSARLVAPQSWGPERSRSLLYADGSKTTLGPAWTRYVELYSEMLRLEAEGRCAFGAVREWRSAAQKVIQTDEGGRTMLEVSASRVLVARHTHYAAEIALYRSTAQGAEGVVHRLRTSKRVVVGAERVEFSNSYEFWLPGDSRPSRARPPDWDSAMQQRHTPVLPANRPFTYDEWWQLVKLPLQQSDVLDSAES